MGMFDTTISGVQAYARHVRIEDDTQVTPGMVLDWLSGFEAYVRLQVGNITWIDDQYESLVNTAARRVIEMYVAGDVLDAAYPDSVGRNEGWPGKELREQAKAELVSLVAEIELLRQDGINSEARGTVSMSAPSARIVDGMMF